SSSWFLKAGFINIVIKERKNNQSCKKNIANRIDSDFTTPAVKSPDLYFETLEVVLSMLLRKNRSSLFAIIRTFINMSFYYITEISDIYFRLNIIPVSASFFSSFFLLILVKIGKHKHWNHFRA